MKLQLWLKPQNSAPSFTTTLPQVHRDSRSWGHWAQHKFEEDPGFTRPMFREGLSTHGRRKGPGVPGPTGGPRGPGPSEGVGQPGGRPAHPPAPLPDVFGVAQQVWGWTGKSVCESGSGVTYTVAGAGADSPGLSWREVRRCRTRSL